MDRFANADRQRVSAERQVKDLEVKLEELEAQGGKALKNQIKKLEQRVSIYLYFSTSATRRRHGGLMIGALDSGSSGPGLSPSRGHCTVFLGKTLIS